MLVTILSHFLKAGKMMTWSARAFGKVMRLLRFSRRTRHSSYQRRHHLREEALSLGVEIEGQKRMKRFSKFCSGLETVAIRLAVLGGGCVYCGMWCGSIGAINFSEGIDPNSCTQQSLDSAVAEGKDNPMRAGLAFGMGVRRFMQS